MLLGGKLRVRRARRRRRAGRRPAPRAGRPGRRRRPHARATPRARSPSVRRTPTRRASPRSCSPATCCSPARSGAPTCRAATTRRCSRPCATRCSRCPTTSSCCPATASRPRSAASAPPTRSCSTCRRPSATTAARHPRTLTHGKPTPLSGFPELLPAARVVEREVIASLSRTFELHGFANIETRAVEPLDRLPRAARSTRRSTSCAGCRPTRRRRRHRASSLGLHFDLTVPFARYVLENAGHLEFPFRRFQIQPAWRGERPQEGRYRQFTQADIDIVGSDELPVPPRRRGDAGDGAGARRAAAAAASPSR